MKLSTPARIAVFRALVLGETAAGHVLRRVRDRLDASEDPRWKAAAFGVAR